MTIELVLFCSIYGLTIIASYTLGLRNGQKLCRKETIEMPKINPVEKIKQNKEEKLKKVELQKQNDAMTIMLENIDNYDGTGIGQREIPS